jgi:proteasome lid subunit RPN8/RPN11
LPILENVIPKIKGSVSRLSGIHVRYGWKNCIPVVFTPNAARELHNYFHWGQWHPQNLSEQLAALIGHKLSDGFLVEFVSPVYLAKRNTTQASFTQESMESGWMETDAINVSYHKCLELQLLEEQCVLLGFVHSHPDDLDLVLSEADVRLHKMLATNGIDLSVILNPQKRQIAAFCREMIEWAEVRILMEHTDVENWDIQN